jgi:hypothetical protein
MITFILILLI